MQGRETERSSRVEQTASRERSISMEESVVSENPRIFTPEGVRLTREEKAYEEIMRAVSNAVCGTAIRIGDPARKHESYHVVNEEVESAQERVKLALDIFVSDPLENPEEDDAS